MASTLDDIKKLLAPSLDEKRDGHVAVRSHFRRSTRVGLLKIIPENPPPSSHIFTAFNLKVKFCH